MSFTAGDTFTTTAELKERVGDSRYGREHTIAEGVEVEIKRVGTKKALVKTTYHNGYSGGYTSPIWLTIEGLQSVAGVVEPETDRPMGEMPLEEGSISAEHEGIQWLWEDIIRYAKKNNIVPTIDKLTDALDIPGRSRVFTAVASINGLETTAQMEARSQKEADKKLKDWIIENV